VIPATVLGREHDFYILRFDHKDTVIELLDRHGSLPLPPYIPREVTQEDEVRYQTVYARKNGAVAAPTAGLHFDEVMLSRLRDMGVLITYVTLHVGAGTFQPVKVENIIDHKMHRENFHVPEESVQWSAVIGWRIATYYVPIGITWLLLVKLALRKYTKPGIS
jgi:S-adenosylmethionine:tRNA ribosyltransferase-isomerase